MHRKKALRPKEVEEIYGIAETTLTSWRYFGKGPRYFKCGKCILYLITEIDEFIQEHTCMTTTMDGDFI